MLYFYEIVVDECRVKDCGNGMCVTQEDGSALCDCDDGYKGAMCNGLC